MFASQENRINHPAIVIFPQCPEKSFWAKTKVDRALKPLKYEFPLETEPMKPMRLVMMLVDEIASKKYVNNKRIYVGGLSMGGMGTLEIVYRKSDFFAAAFSICGAGNPEATNSYAKTTPFWIFHGANDDVVSPQYSIEMVSAILKNGGKPNFTLYANANHNSWDSAFAEPELLSWLFSNSKNNKK